MLDEAQRVAVPNDERHRGVRREARRQHYRPGARSAAAMRGRERLVQVDVHRIDAEIARPRLADDRVEVCAVAVEIGACVMHRLGDPDDLPFEQPAGVRIRQHDCRDVGAESAS